MMNSVKNKPLGTVTNGPSPKDSCDDLGMDVLAVVSSVIAEKLLPCGICTIGAVVQLSCCLPSFWRKVDFNVELEIVDVEFFSVL